MDKNIRSAVAVTGMSSNTSLVVDSSVQQALVNLVLSFRTSVQGTSVSAEIRDKITNLKGVLDTKTLTSARNGGDWRRGQGSASSSSSASSSASSAASTTNTASAMNSGSFSSHAHLNQNDNRWRPNAPGRVRTNGFTNSNGQGQGHSHGQGQGQGQKPPVYTGPPIGRYQSRFKNQTEAIEEKILNRIILLKLNKFGPTTYTEIRDFLFQILGQEAIATEEGGNMKAEEGQVAEFVRDFMLMVFKKAAAEEIYCPLYAKLLAEIGSKHSVIFEEMGSLYERYMEIFEEPDVNSAAISNEAFEKKNIEKKYRQGYSQFIAELTALEILSLDALANTTKMLIKLVDKHSRIEDNKPLVDEYVDCILRMSRVLKSKRSQFFVGARNRLWQDNRETIGNLINVRDSTYCSLTPKSRFLMMDIQEIYNTA